MLGGHEYPSTTGKGELTGEFCGETRIGGGQHFGGERVVPRTAECDTGVGQVGIDLQVSVAGVPGGAAGRGHPGAHQGDHQIANRSCPRLL